MGISWRSVAFSFVTLVGTALTGCPDVSEVPGTPENLIAEPSYDSAAKAASNDSE